MRLSALIPMGLALLVAAHTPPASARNPPFHRCPTPIPHEQAIRELEEANQAIHRAGEHPSSGDLNDILPRLHRAAYAGLPEAQLRFGMYVVGYFYTDNLFWPKQPHIAIPALAMLRIAALATTAPTDPLLIALAKKTPSFTDPDGPPALPRKWVRAAMVEAERFLACQRRSAATPSER